MPSIARVVRRLSKFANAAMRHPRETILFLNQLPSLVQGLKYGRETAFKVPRPNETGSNDKTNSLLAYFNEHQEGRGIWKWLHYFDIYQRHFGKFVGREVHILEVGVYSGGSLDMWKHYFGPGCHVYGVDIEPACRSYQGERTEIFIGDQSDRSFWARVKEAVPTVDILLDDGGHLPDQQRITLEEMLPHLNAGGVYLCEDISGLPHHFGSFVQGLATHMHAMAVTEPPGGAPGLASVATNFQQAIAAIHLYPFVTVIEKREQSVPQFVAPKHGTQWQPFL